MKKTGKITGILQRIMGRKGTVFIILAGLLLLTACREKKQESGSETYLYVPKQIQADILSGNYSLNKCNFHVTEDYLYFLDNSLYRIPIKNGLDFDAREEFASYKDLFQNLDVQSSYEGTTTWNDILCFTVDKQGNLYYCATSYSEMCVILNKRSADGEHIYQIPMEPEESLYSDPILAVDNGGNAYIAANNTIRRYDPEGNLTGQLALEEDFNGNFLIRKYMMELPGGDIYFFVDSSVDGSRKAYKILEGSTPRLENLESLSENMSMSTLYPGLDGLLIAESDGWLYQYHDEDQSKEALLLWEDSDIYKNEISAVVQVTENFLLVVLRDDNPDADGPAQTMTLLTRTPADEVPQKEQIILASLFPTSDLQEAVVKFNQGSDQYHVTIERYGVKSWFDDNEGAYIRLDSSLTSKNNAPDLLDFTELDIRKYADIGALDDLYSYIGTEGSILKEDFLGNLLEGYTINGKLICIPKAFSFMGAWITDERALEAEDWSIESLMAVADKYEDVRLFPSSWDQPDVMLRLFFADYILDKFIDRENGKCRLDSDEFCSLLEWVKEQTQQNNDSQSSLLTPEFINGFENYHQTLTDSEEKTALRGLPTLNGKMTYNVSADNALGMVANSSHKEGAWEFLNYFLQRELDMKHSVYTYRFPTKIATLDLITEDITTPNYVEIDGKIINGADGKPLVNPESARYINGIYSEYYAMEKSDAEAMRKLLEQIDFTPRSNLEQSIISIITEESAPFFDGVKSAAEAAYIIQNRAQTILSENQ